MLDSKPHSTTFGAQDGIDHVESRLVTLETLVKSVLGKIEQLCALRTHKQGVGGKTKFAPTIVAKVVGKYTH
jgi:hypothetical protein